ncbi:MAG: alpha/beta fold hydrolase [Anaerolineae bacterium]
MPKAQIRGILMVYDEVGAGQSIVFIHGSPFNRSMWKPQLDTFGNRYRVVACDLRGYGETTVVPGTTTLEDFAGDVSALLDMLDINRAVIVGLSMGGLVTLEFFRQFRERVMGLVLADTYAHKFVPDPQQTRFVAPERILNEGMSAYAHEFLPQMLAPYNVVQQPGVAAQVLTMMENTSAEGVAAALRGRDTRCDYLPMLGEITVPALVVVGRDDVMTPVADSERIHKGIKGSQLVTIDDAGHMPNLEQPTAFNAALRQFLSQFDDQEMPNHLV